MKFIFFIVVLAIAFWVFSDARARGKSLLVALFWFFGTMMLMIVFLPLWLLVRPKWGYEVVDSNKQTMCIHCGKYYEGAPAFCSNCGESLRS
jgi:hypothetical protein